MKRLLVFFIMLTLPSASFATVGWYQDYVKINSNNSSESFYWIGSNPSFGTQFQGTNFGNVSSLEITGCDMKYWSDNQDRTGGSFFYKIMSSDGLTQIVAPVETIWTQSYLGGNDYQGTKTISINLLNGLNLNDTYQIHIWAKSWGSSQGDSYLSNGGANYVATFTYTPTTFTGVGNWTESARWNYGLPTSVSKAIISGTAAISSNVTIQDLEISSGNGLTVNDSKSLTVLGTLTNSAGNSGLIIASGGSLIHSSASVSATVQRTINGWGDVNHGWHFLSSPMVEQAIDPAFTDLTSTEYDFYTWYESSNLWVNYKNTSTAPTWNTANGSVNFTPGKGYLAEYKDTDTKQFTGTLNYQNISITNLAISAGGNRGWHLLGNPFTSALTWGTAAWSLTHINGQAKIWDEASAAYVDLAAGSGIIPALNGFMVQVTDTYGGSNSLTIPTAAKVHSAQPWYKSSDSPSMTLVANDPIGKTAQQSIVTFSAEASEGFDPALDAHFLAGYAPKFYSMAGAEQLSTNALPESGGTVQIPFSFVKNENTSFSIEAKTISNLYGPVILNDLKTGASQDLSQNPSYSFTSQTGDDPARFLVTFNHMGVDDPQKSNGCKIYASGQNIIISGNELQNEGVVFIYNIIGQRICKQALTGDKMLQINLEGQSGYYLVKVVTGFSSQTEKVFIK